MKQKLENIIESLLLSSSRPLSESEILRAFDEGDNLTISDIKEAISNLKELYNDRSFELVKVANGFRLKIRQKYSPWISKLWESKPQKYSRAMMETLALIAYKQPLTRGEIEEVRGPLSDDPNEYKEKPRYDYNYSYSFWFYINSSTDNKDVHLPMIDFAKNPEVKYNPVKNQLTITYNGREGAVLNYKNGII